MTDSPNKSESREAFEKWVNDNFHGLSCITPEKDAISYMEDAWQAAQRAFADEAVAECEKAKREVANRWGLNLTEQGLAFAALGEAIAIMERLAK